MIQILQPLKRTIISSVVAVTLLTSSLSAGCTYQLFSISSVKGTKISEFVDRLSDECSFTVIITDNKVQKLLEKRLNKTNLKNLTVDEVLDIVLKENNLFYKIENNILYISYIVTKTFDIDYIITTRKSTGTTNVTISSKSGMSAADGGNSFDTSQTSSSESQSGISVETTDELSFWKDLDLEFQSILNRPEDDYSADAPIINKAAGLVTVTASVKQLTRLEKYLNNLQRKIKAQVLIDVKLLNVTLDNKHETGVDWSQLYALQNFQLTSQNLRTKNAVADGATGTITSLSSALGTINGSAVNIIGSGKLNEVIKFLKTQGDVKAISNPKILTLNNQPALISVGSEFFYKIKQTTQQQSSGGGVASTLENDVVNSVFAGILLDITPEIDNNGLITLKINPSISQTRQDITANTDGSIRDVPPDLDKRQLSSVVTVQDGERVILGGLIQSKNSINENKVPLLGDIPLLGWAFKYKEKIKTIEELVLVIEPHIIKNGKQSVSLSELGYRGINEQKLDASSFINLNNKQESKKSDKKITKTKIEKKDTKTQENRSAKEKE